MTTASVVAFWHITSLLPPSLVFDFELFGQNRSYATWNYGDSSILSAVGDKLKIFCVGDYELMWIKLNDTDKVTYSKPTTIISNDHQLIFDSLKTEDAGLYACASKSRTAEKTDSDYATQKNPVFVAVNIKIVPSDDQQMDNANGRIFRHTSDKTTVPSGNPVEMCVNWQQPSTSTLATDFENKSRSDEFSKTIWQLPDQLSSLAYENQNITYKIYSPLDYSDGKKSDQLSLCLYIPVTEQMHSGVYKLNLFNAADINPQNKKKINKLSDTISNKNDRQNLSVSFTVEVISPFTSTVNVSSESEQQKPIRLVTDKFYQFTCRLQNTSQNNSIGNRANVYFVEGKPSGQSALSWCPANGQKMLSAIDILEAKIDAESRMHTRTVKISQPYSTSNFSFETSGFIACSPNDEDTSSLPKETKLPYTIVDNQKFVDKNSDLLIETEIGDTYSVATSDRKIVLPQGARMVLKCIAPRCLFGELKWVRMENNEVFAYVNSQSNPLNMDSDNLEKVALNQSNTENGSEQIISRLYTSSPLTIVFETVFPAVRHNQAGTYACLASSDSTNWKNSTVKVQVRPQTKSRQKSASALRVVAIPPLEVASTKSPSWNPPVPISHRIKQPLCSEQMRHIVVAVTVAAVVSLLLVAVCSLALCYRLNRVNLLKQSSIIIRSPSNRNRNRSIKTRLIGSNAPSLAAEEEVSI